MRWGALALAVALYALAMAYVEAAVVVDLNGALGQQVGTFVPVVIDPSHATLGAIEVGREVATLVMLGAVGWLAGGSPIERLAWGAVAFGAWDIGYYGWLRLFSGWPPGPATWDVLFLVPVPWLGPVWAPLSVSVALVGFGLAATRRLRAGGSLRVSPRQAAAAGAGGLLVIVSFTLNAPALLAGALPTTFPWAIFGAGMALGVGAAVDVLRRFRRAA